MNVIPNNGSEYDGHDNARRRGALKGGGMSSLRPVWLMRVMVCSAVLAACFAGTAAADWPVYGHDLGNSRSADADGPLAGEAATLQRAWTFNSSNGDFTGTPVIAAGTLIAGTNLGSIYALDAVTGKVRWSHEVGQQIN